MEIVVTSPDELRQLVNGAIADYFKNNSTPQAVASSTNDRLISAKELSHYVGLTVQTLIRYRKKGRIPAVKVGPNVRFDLKAVIKALGK